MAELLDIVCKTLDEKQAEDIVVIDMRTSNPYSDYYVVCTSRNQRHGASLAEFCEQEAEKNGYAVRVREGDRDSNWILLDLGEVVVHIFIAWKDSGQICHSRITVVQKHFEDGRKIIFLFGFSNSSILQPLQDHGRSQRLCIGPFQPGFYVRLSIDQLYEGKGGTGRNSPVLCKTLWKFLGVDAGNIYNFNHGGKIGGSLPFHFIQKCCLDIYTVRIIRVEEQQ